jgi:hypothetical protein
MGEYAKRKSDGVEVKIGTCESMYYLRYEDRAKVAKLPNSLDPAAENGKGLFFRLPFPDEDDTPIGQYEDFNRGLRLYQTVNAGTASSWMQDFSDDSTIEDPGIMQLHHGASGLLLNVPCYHGAKLPQVVSPMQAFWNGKGHSFELAHIKPTDEGVKPVVRCRHCGHMWRYQWSDVWDYLQPEMRQRLAVYNVANPTTLEDFNALVAEDLEAHPEAKA